jgi:hypothetical protein
MNLSRPTRAISDRRVALGGVVVVEHGEDAPTSVFDADRFFEEGTACPF